MELNKSNPAGNRLESGVSEEELASAIVRSGYPLQHRVAIDLAPTFSVTEEWGYSDRKTNEPRSLDLFAHRRVGVDSTKLIQLRTTLLVECKRSELPFVFFGSATTGLPRNYPKVFGFSRNGFSLHDEAKSSRELRYSDILRMDDFKFVSAGPPVCRSFSRAERSGQRLTLSGEVPFREAVMPLVHAVHHLDSQFVYTGRTPPVFPTVVVLVAVLDAPMVLAAGQAEDVKLAMAPWIRVVRQESEKENHGVSTRHYVIDFVHADFLSGFISQELLPFVDAIAARVDEGAPVLLRGNGRVPSLDGWTWQDVVRSQPAT